MDTKHLIELLGGPASVMELTGLSKGRISQWVTANKITRSWLEYLKLKRKDIPWDHYDGVPDAMPEIEPLATSAEESNEEQRRDCDLGYRQPADPHKVDQ